MLFCVVLPVDASLKLNELYPSPDKGSTEWLEIVNNGSESVSTSGYLIRDAANNTLPLASFQLEPEGFFIATTSSLLNNTGDTVYLLNPTGEVVDIATYAATLTSSQSYANCPVNQWVITTAISRDQPNTEACIQNSPSPSPTVSPGTTPTPIAPVTPSPATSPTVLAVSPVLSEVMTSPESGNTEWVELYNPHSSHITLEELQIDDTEGGSRPRNMSGTIPPHSYYVIALSTGIFNNDGDQVRLLSMQGAVIDSFSFSKTEKGSTWGRQQLTVNSSACIMQPSQGEKNTPCVTEELMKTASEADQTLTTESQTMEQPATTESTSFSATNLPPTTSTHLEEYTAAFSNTGAEPFEIPLTVQLHSSEPPDTKSTTVALTLSLTGSLFSFFSILLKINRVYLPL